MNDKKKPDERSRQERIDKAMFILAEIFEKDLSEPALELYHKLLRPFSIKDVENAFYVWMNSTDSDIYNYFPRPNQLIRIIKEAGKGSVAARALQQWQGVMCAVRQYGINHPPTFIDPITDHLVQTQFTWSFLCSIEEPNLPFEQRRWCEAYDLASELHADLQYVTAPERILKLVKPIGKIE